MKRKAKFRQTLMDSLTAMICRLETEISDGVDWVCEGTNLLGVHVEARWTPEGGEEQTLGRPGRADPHRRGERRRRGQLPGDARVNWG